MDQQKNNKTEKTLHPKAKNRRVHLANERTFLAWIRTSIAIMAFGFVVEKFALFLNQMSYFLGKEIPYPPHKHSTILGAILIALGTLMGILSFIRYKKIERQIDEDTYHPSLILDLLITLAILAIGLFLVIYLLHSL